MAKVIEKTLGEALKSHIEKTKRKDGSPRVKFHTGNISKVQQNFKESTDIKYILDKYQKTGELPINQNEALYGDFTNPVSYQEALEIQMRAAEQFEGLSAEVRKRFDNDPSEFLLFCSEEKNKDEMIKMGLLNKPEIIDNEPIAVVIQDQKPAASDQQVK